MTERSPTPDGEPDAAEAADAVEVVDTENRPPVLRRAPIGILSGNEHPNAGTVTIETVFTDEAPLPFPNSEQWDDRLLPHARKLALLLEHLLATGEGAVAVTMRVASDVPDFPSEYLPAAALARLGAMTNAERRRQSAWARALVLLLKSRIETLTGEAMEYAEDPPYGPLLVRPRDARVFFATLSHTTGAVGVLLSAKPAGIDLEAERPLTKLERLAPWAFGEEVGGMLLEDIRARRSPDPFFALWGLKECVVKMNRGDDVLKPHRLIFEPREARMTARVEGPAGRARIRFMQASGVRTTLAAFGPHAPQLYETSPERTLFEFTGL